MLLATLSAIFGGTSELVDFISICSRRRTAVDVVRCQALASCTSLKAYRNLCAPAGHHAHTCQEQKSLNAKTVRNALTLRHIGYQQHLPRALIGFAERQLLYLFGIALVLCSSLIKRLPFIASPLSFHPRVVPFFCRVRHKHWHSHSGPLRRLQVLHLGFNLLTP